jgi:hypothetical protein
MAPIGIIECKRRRRVQIRMGIGLPGLIVLTGAAVAIWAVVIGLLLWL